MGLFSRLFGSESRSAADWLPRVFSIVTGNSIAGEAVSAETALGLSAVWSAVQILSDAIVGLPIHVKDAQDVKVDHPIGRLLANDGEANDHMNAIAVKGALMANVALWGNAYAVIERDATGQPVALYPLLSRYTSPRRFNGQLVYTTQVADKSHTLAAGDVLHILGPLTLDGIVGLSPIQYQRETVGLSAALEKFAAKFFAQGGNVGGIIETPPMKEEALKNFIETWRKTYTGPDAAFKIAALTAGMKFHRTTADPKESQALDSREYQVREVARIFRIPPHMLGDLEKASYASIEQQNMEFYQGTIQPYAIRLESEIARKLLLESEKGRLSVRFNLDAKLRGTTTERYSAYMTGRQGGWLSINDIRKLENLPTVDGGDELMQPLNMTPAGSGQKGQA